MAQTKKSKVRADLTALENYQMVPVADIKIVDRPAEGGDDRLFFNPRSLESFSPEEMQFLMESIQQDGLQQPPIVRIFTEGSVKDGDILRVELVAGERRLRSIMRLIEENAPCQVDDKQVPAAEALGSIPCKVYYNISDEKALRLAFVENDQHQSLTTQEEVSLVERLVRRGLKQDEIAGMLGSNVTWVSQTGNFRSELPKEAFEKLLRGEMSRHVAVKILSFPKDKRELLFDETLRKDKEVYEETKAALQDEVEKAEDMEDMAEQQEATAKDEEAKKKAKKIKKEAKKKQEEAKKKQERLEKEKGIIRQGTLQAAAQEAGIAPKKAQALTKGMIEQFYVDLLGKWLDNGKIDPVVKKEMPAEVLEVMRATARAILCGHYDPAQVVRSVMVSRGDWKLPDGYEEEEQDALEVKEDDQEIE